MHELALLINHAPFAICKDHIKAVIDVVKVVRVPLVTKSSSEGGLGGFAMFVCLCYLKQEGHRVICAVKS